MKRLAYVDTVKGACRLTRVPGIHDYGYRRTSEPGKQHRRFAVMLHELNIAWNPVLQQLRDCAAGRINARSRTAELYPFVARRHRENHPNWRLA